MTRRLLDRYPFARSEVPATAGAAILWWESRRIAYNAIVGATGIVTIAVLVASAMIRGDDCGMPAPPLFALLGVIAYGIMANLCYTIGEVTELAARPILGVQRASQLAQTAFVAGVALSIVLTLAPAVILPLLCLAPRAG